MNLPAYKQESGRLRHRKRFWNSSLISIKNTKNVYIYILFYFKFQKSHYLIINNHNNTMFYPNS